MTVERFPIEEVWPGDTLTATVTVTDISDGLAHFELTTTNQSGKVVLSGTAAGTVAP